MKLDNPTSRDIAEIAGVSQATVSRALRNSPLVREETRERIQRIARELNYFVNRNAAGLRSQQSNTIALLLFDETEGTEVQINPFFLSMFGYITRSAAALGYDVLVSLQQLSDDWHIEYQASRRADGLILLGYGDYVAYREKLDALAAAAAAVRVDLGDPAALARVVDDAQIELLLCDAIDKDAVLSRRDRELTREQPFTLELKVAIDAQRLAAQVAGQFGDARVEAQHPGRRRHEGGLGPRREAPRPWR